MSRTPRSQPYILYAPMTGSQVERLNQMLQELYDDIRNGSIDLSTGSVSGVLPVANGGTNKSSYTAGSVIFAGASGLTLTEDNANLYYDFTNHRVGIGTSSPTVSLDINGGGFLMRNGGNFVVNSTNSAWSKNAAVSTRVVLLVGSGDSTGVLPDLSFTGGTLTGVKYQASLQALGGGFTNGICFDLLPVLSADGSARAVTNQYGLRVRGETNDANITVTNSYGVYVDGPAAGATNNVAAYFGGKVGIGTITPAEYLDVNPSSGAAAIRAKGTTGSLLLDHTTANSFSSISFKENGTDLFIMGTGVYSADTTNFDLGIAGAGNTLLRVTSGGLVGIGLTNVTSRLALTTPNSVTTSIHGQIAGINDSTASTFEIGIAEHNVAPGSRAAMQFLKNNAAATSMEIAFKVYDGAVGTAERLRIEKTGKIGINTASPKSRLHIEGQSGWIIADEQDTDPTTTELDANDSVSYYTKSNKLVFAYNNAGTITYVKLPLDGSSTTWVHDTTAP